MNQKKKPCYNIILPLISHLNHLNILSAVRHEILSAIGINGNKWIS